MVKADQDTLTTTNLGAMKISFTVNASGVLLPTQALLPNILVPKNPKIGMVFSRVDCIDSNTSGGTHSCCEEH